MARLISIDLGLKRTGLAVTDPEQIIATPLETVNTVDLLKYLDNYFQKEEVEKIILGDPKKLDGSPTHSTEAVINYYKKLKKRYPDKKVFLVDERFTTKMAMDAMITGGSKKKDRKNKGVLDKLSATIILQSYMEQQSRI